MHGEDEQMINKRLLIAAVLCLAFFSCATQPGTPPPAVLPEKTPAIAVWDLENLSPDGSAQVDLGDLLSAKIMEAVRQHHQYALVERQQLQLVLRELDLGSSSLADPATQLRIGKIAGAGLMMFGAYQVVGNQMRLDLRMVEVETGRVLKASERTVGSADLAEWLAAAEAAANELL